ncbi:prepilin-type N-terminal cleavage/methylation domain-containing protein [Coraliomargarita sp. SDUM461003]|uniref:Prepilin-type N-terminal cleavage/methylation domain-containing protein n=1 Tax=Thalassobacterium maritimum TaxID=3041265 RepID=A0ABU1ATA1_9BACT|nr:prepilin-type N-terminal cleavage/methylation domain-containing protein [Coraliomargarita sp. SDUM461003]MDQ8207401.1 prepilin-type N-terminal cleavage/methylation domain-containing protein [Coraliomargarita sp. SDUM461003]
MKISRKSLISVGRRGFSLVELIVSTGLLGMVMASMVSTFVVFASGTTGVAAYTEMSRESRKALEYFARDVRSASDVTSASQYDIIIEVPDDAYYDGGSVQYIFDVDYGIFSRIVRDKLNQVSSNEILLDGVEQFTFGFFDPLGQPLDHATESLILSVKSVQVDAEMVRTVSRSEATDYIISARFMMRNRPVTK